MSTPVGTFNLGRDVIWAANTANNGMSPSVIGTNRTIYSGKFARVLKFREVSVASWKAPNQSDNAIAPIAINSLAAIHPPSEADIL
jgi:hypothetical protein